jgi:membrane-associated phospholipid phosphatase
MAHARPSLPLTVAAGATLAFGVLARLVRQRPHNPADAGVRAQALARSGPAARAAHAPLGGAGKGHVLMPLSLLGAGALALRRLRARPPGPWWARARQSAPRHGASWHGATWHGATWHGALGDGRARGALAAGAPLLLASVAGWAAAEGADAWLPSRPPPPGRNAPDEPSFPSGHSLRPAALALTAGWVAWREGLLPGPVAAPLALGVPLLFGAVQVPGERHWASDVLGGWLAGLALAGGCAALYEALAAD